MGPDDESMGPDDESMWAAHIPVVLSQRLDFVFPTSSSPVSVHTR